MTPPADEQVTQVLQAAGLGDPRASEQLLPLVYDELRRLAHQRMAKEPPGQTIQATALVHEAFMKLVGSEDPGWDGRAHFYGAAAEAMRQILVDRARKKNRLKHGGHLRKVGGDAIELASDGPNFDVLALDEALERLATDRPRKAQLVKLRFFGGLSIPEAAEVLGISTATAERDWRFAKAWLECALGSVEGHG